jgi:prolyl 4-hydroxylase
MNFIGQYQAKETSFCDSLIKYFDDSALTGQGTILNKDGATLIDTSVKENLSLTLYLNIEEKMIKDYLLMLKACTEAYKKEFSYCDKYSAWGISEPAAILKYKPFSNGFVYHTERFSSKFPAVNRHLVFMTYLNDVPIGGETEFYYQKIKVRPQKGLTLIWPADWTHTHRGNPLADNNKYIISGWFSFL